MQVYNSIQGFVTVLILSLGVVIAALTSKSIPLLSNYRLATFILLVLGLLMCTFGGMGYVFSNNLFSPFTLAGSILGILALIIGILSVFNKKVPFLNSPKEAFILLAVIIFLKIILTKIHLFLIR